ncbi:MAG: mercuric reductase [Acidobacteriota bacterium]
METGRESSDGREWASSTVGQYMDSEHAEDRTVLENCHPPGYCNPSGAGDGRRYNLIAIGAGAAGLVSAGGAGMLGGRAALIERNLLGGDCLNTGCVPSKALIRASRAVYEAEQSGQFGLPGEMMSGRADFGAAMERLRRVRARISHHDSVQRFQEKFGVDVFLGEARFTGPDSLEVDGQQLRFARAVIATGGRPAIPAIPGLVGNGYYTSESIFALRQLPARLAVIGGGPIGCELAQVFQRYGSRVTILNAAAQLLPREERDAALTLERRLRDEGVMIHHGVKISHIEPPGRIVYFTPDRPAATVMAEAILVATGRVPNLEGLDLEAAGIDYDADGVIVDDHLRTSNRRVYAAGDVCSDAKFTHVADAMARIVIRNALFFGRERMSRLVIPRVTYTDPEIAHVGWSRKDGERAGVELLSLTAPLDENDRAIIDGEENGYVTVHVDQRSGLIRGGTIVARHAGEMIGQLTLAITQGLKIGALARTIQPYPTLSDSLRRVADNYEMDRIRPWQRRLLKLWLSWNR